MAQPNGHEIALAQIAALRGAIKSETQRLQKNPERLGLDAPPKDSPTRFSHQRT
jgi:hypothetical protein